MDNDGTSLAKSTQSVVADLTISMDDEGFDEYEPMDELFVKANGPQTISFRDLADATNNFSEPLGEGGFGAVCKGFLKELNCYVAVKRLSRDSRQGLKEFASEVTIISQLRHRNILPLKGWCYERKELLLVYEFMSKGSLDHHLFNETSLLTWEVRYKIVLELASGLRYLQEELEDYVVHRDIKASNVMLDSNFNPKLGDFGIARRVERGRGPNETPLAGTPGYVAPEYSVTHKASKESDIYSFGIVALEIACGRKIIDRKAREDEINLREWVWDLYGKGKLLEAADRKLNGDFDKEQVECLMIVGLWCAHPYEKSRPCIEKAIHVLSFIVPLPDLPSSMPMIIDSARFSMSSVGTNLVDSPNSFSEDEKLGKRGVVVLDERLDHPRFGEWEMSTVKYEEYGRRRFSYEELVRATNNFSEQNKLEQNDTGVVYQGFLKEVNSFVAVNVYMHCEGCARNVLRCLKGFEGVEDVTTDCKTSKEVVKGEKADPLKVLARVQRKSHRQVELISPIPKPPSDEEKKATAEEKKPEPEPPKKEEAPVVTVVLKVYMHCDACAVEIKKQIRRMKGVESAEPDLKSSEVTVKGVFEPEKLVEYVHKRTGKHASIVKQETEKKGGEEEDGEKGKESKEEKKEDEKKPEEEKKEEGEAPGGGGDAKSEAEETTEEVKLVELKKNEYYYYPPMELYAPPHQMFSDENPNACTVM